MGFAAIDLRSDTVTKPSPGMRAAMAAAPVGDDVYGEDPTLNELERRTAELLGHEAGLFVASGTGANQLGLRLHSREPATEILAEWAAHVLRAESGAAAALSGITTRTWRGRNGLVDLPQIEQLIAPRFSPYLVSTAAIAVENTHNFGGGTIQPIEDLRALRDLAVRQGLTLHLDGARLWNAHVATGVPLADYGRLFDTVSVCYSKGLGAPVGSVLVGSADRIAEARFYRRLYGGGMRQAGIVAAGALYALEHHLPGLAEDHRRARELAEAVAKANPAVTDPAAAPTNIVVLDLTETPWTAGELATAAAERGVRVSALAPRTARLVTHRDIDDDGTATAAAVLADLLRR